MATTETATAPVDSIDAFIGMSKHRVSDLLTDVALPKRVTVVYDSTCELCRHARSWLEGQRTYVPLDFLAATDASRDPRYAGVPWLGEELVVIADDGRTWVGAGAFITAMWTTRRYRSWAYRLSGDSFSVLARYFFHTVTTQRGRISGMLKGHECDGDNCAVETRNATAAIPQWPEVPADSHG